MDTKALEHELALVLALGLWYALSASVGNRQHVGKFRCHGYRLLASRGFSFKISITNWSNKDQSERIGVVFADSQIAEPLNFGDSVVVVFVHDGMRAVLHKARNE